MARQWEEKEWAGRGGEMTPNWKAEAVKVKR